MDKDAKEEERGKGGRIEGRIPMTERRKRLVEGRR